MTPEEFQTALVARGIGRQIDAAAALRKDQSTISRWLKGTLPIPPIVEVALQGIPTTHVRPKSRTSPNGSKTKRARN